MQRPDIPQHQNRLAGGPATGLARLGAGRPGMRGVVVRVGAESDAAVGGIEPDELERRLLEIGFVEGAAVEILHQGLIDRDPIAVRVDDRRVALRRREADAIMVRVAGTADMAPGEESR